MHQHNGLDGHADLAVQGRLVIQAETAALRYTGLMLGFGCIISGMMSRQQHIWSSFFLHMLHVFAGVMHWLATGYVCFILEGVRHLPCHGRVVADHHQAA